MTESVISTAGENSSFSSYSTTLGASILAAALLSNAIPMGQAALNRVAAGQEIQYQEPYIDQSYSDSTVNQTSIDQQLFVALQELYSELVASQQELDPETRRLLHSNLWALYE